MLGTEENGGLCRRLVVSTLVLQSLLDKRYKLHLSKPTIYPFSTLDFSSILQDIAFSVQPNSQMKASIKLRIMSDSKIQTYSGNLKEGILIWGDGTLRLSVRIALFP